jgi:hypothetical protein
VVKKVRITGIMSQETTETGGDHIFLIMGNMTASSFDADTGRI